MIAFAARAPLPVSLALVGVFAIFHCYAHGAELPAFANSAAYFSGFVLATGLLHLIGIAAGLLTRFPHDAIAVKIEGGAIALLGLGMLFGLP